MNARPAPAGVHLRPLGARDEDFYVAIYTDPARLAQVGPPLDDAAARRSFAAALREAARPAPRRRLWVIAEGAPGVDVGLIGLIGDAHQVEMGAVVQASCQGRGLARAAVVALAAIAYGELGVARLHARCTRANAAAIAVLGKAGFVRQPDVDDEVRWEWPPPRRNDRDR
jgi:RimJ/RimL family protein N-acetyltransferase